MERIGSCLSWSLITHLSRLSGQAQMVAPPNELRQYPIGGATVCAEVKVTRVAFVSAPNKNGNGFSHTIGPTVSDMNSVFHNHQW